MQVDGWAIGSSRVMVFRLLCVCFCLGALRSTATGAGRQEVRKTSATFLLLTSTVLEMFSTLGLLKRAPCSSNGMGERLWCDRFNLKERPHYPLSMKIGGHQSRCWWVGYKINLVIDGKWIPGHLPVVSYFTVDYLFRWINHTLSASILPKIYNVIVGVKVTRLEIHGCSIMWNKRDSSAEIVFEILHSAREMTIWRNPHISSNWYSRITGQLGYKHTFCQHTVFTNIACPHVFF
jgi:hypothetical protein